MCKSRDPFFYFLYTGVIIYLELAGERRFATLAALAIICFKTDLSHIHVHIYIHDIGLSQ